MLAWLNAKPACISGDCPIGCRRTANSSHKFPDPLQVNTSGLAWTCMGCYSFITEELGTVTLFPPSSRVWQACLILALFGQLLPATCASACVARCCGQEGPGSCCKGLLQTVDEAATKCPNCASSDRESRQTAPCQCGLLARHDPALAPLDRLTLDLDRSACRAVGIIQRAFEDDLTPIQIASDGGIRPPISRPVRILYGVWRN